MPFINTPSVNDVLNQHWLAGLFPHSSPDLKTKLKFALCLISLGLLAPLLMECHSDDVVDKVKNQNNTTDPNK